MGMASVLRQWDDLLYLLSMHTTSNLLAGMQISPVSYLQQQDNNSVATISLAESSFEIRPILEVCNNRTAVIDMAQLKLFVNTVHAASLDNLHNPLDHSVFTVSSDVASPAITRQLKREKNKNKCCLW